ncbi:MAG: LCP family protein [Coriobacteriales bacterium]|nr:LCP family protein [Coriobacteriales bacterium]
MCPRKNPKANSANELPTRASSRAANGAVSRAPKRASGRTANGASGRATNGVSGRAANGTSSRKTNGASTKATKKTSKISKKAAKQNEIPVPGPSRNDDVATIRERTKDQARHKRNKKIIIGISSGILGFLLIAGVAIGLYLVKLNSIISPSDDTSFDQAGLNDALVKAKEGEAFYVLILGDDARPGEMQARSDTIILCRVDPLEPQITLLSIPRDTKIYIEGYGTQKINAALAYGGQSGAVKAVSELCDVDISHYVEVRFEGVIDLVNSLGGVNIDVPFWTSYDGVSIGPGPQTLDGWQALTFVRSRNFPSGDFQRVQNQRLFIQAVAKQVLGSSAFDMPGIVETLAECVRTDLSVTDAIDLLLKMRGLNTDEMHMATAPSHSSFESGASYVVLEEEAFAEMMSRIKQGLSPIDEAAVNEDNPENQNS